MTRLRKILLLTTLAALVGALLLPTGATASKGQWSVFEDHTALIKSGGPKRISVPERDQGPGRRHAPHRGEVERGRSRAELEDEAQVRRIRPDRLRQPLQRLSRVLPLRRRDQPRPGNGLPDHHHDHRRRAALGDRRRQRHGLRTPTSAPSAGEYAHFAAAVAKRYSGSYAGLPAVLLLLDLERAQPPPLHQADQERAAASTATWWMRRSRRSAPTQRPDAKIFVGETGAGRPRAEGDGPEGVLPQVAVPQQPLQAHPSGSGLPQLQEDRRRRLRAPPLRPDRRASPKTRDVINMLAIRQLGEYLDRAAAARAHPRASCRSTTPSSASRATRPTGSSARAPSRQAALINEKEEYSYRYGRLKSYSQYLLFDDPPRKGPLCVKWSGFQTGAAVHERRRRSPPTPPTSSRSWCKKRGRRGVSVWGRVRPGTGQRSVQLQRKGGGQLGPADQDQLEGLLRGEAQRSRGRYRFRAYDVRAASCSAQPHREAGRPALAPWRGVRSPRSRCSLCAALAGCGGDGGGGPSEPTARAQWSIIEDHTPLIRSGEERREQRCATCGDSAPTRCALGLKWNEVAPAPALAPASVVRRRRPGRVSRLRAIRRRRAAAPRTWASA